MVPERGLTAKRWVAQQFKIREENKSQNKKELVSPTWLGHWAFRTIFIWPSGPDHPLTVRSDSTLYILPSLPDFWRFRFKFRLWNAYYCISSILKHTTAFLPSCCNRWRPVPPIHCFTPSLGSQWAAASKFSTPTNDKFLDWVIFSYLNDMLIFNAV